MPKAALSYFGHVVRAGGMEDDVMLGRMNGARRRGRPRQRWLDTLMGYSSGATISTMRRYARDRAGWRGAATAVARSRMRLDGTRWQGEVGAYRYKFSFDRNNFKNMLTLTPFLHGSDRLYLWHYVWDISVTNTRTTQSINQSIIGFYFVQYKEFSQHYNY